MSTTAQATMANRAMTIKIARGEKRTPEDYANVLNLNNQVFNESEEPAVVLTATAVIGRMWAAAQKDGYTVIYDKEADTFSVTGGSNG